MAALTDRHDDQASIVQVVAHPDDDLYFLNPDLAADLARGVRVLSVIVTCGETDGVNQPAGTRAHGEAAVDYPGYSAARQIGLMHAYAVMSGLDAHSPWQREVLEVIPGVQSELVTLTSRPSVRLLFLNLWQEPLRSPAPREGRLRQVWQGEAEAVLGMVPTGSAMTKPGEYSRGDLIKALVEIFLRFRPTLVRTMDPDPDFQRHDGENRQHADYGDYSDHQDHTATALFTMAALQRYAELPEAQRHSVVAYRGYYNERWPFNLTKSAFEAKAALLAVYGWADGHVCATGPGCGDRKVGDMAPGTGWGQSQTYRYPASNATTHRRADGRLEVYGVVNGQAARWIQTSPGADSWSSAPALPRCPIAPQLALAELPDGRVTVFAIQVTLGPKPSDHQRDLVYCTQLAPDGEFSSWEGLGTPHAGEDASRRRGLGLPAVAVRPDGAVFVFVRTYGGGLACRIHDGTSWSGWLDLGGSEIQEGLSCAVRPDGRVDVVAAHRLGVYTWYQEKPGENFERELLHTAVPVAPPSLVALPDGRLALLLRRRGDTQVIGYYSQSDERAWDLAHHSMQSPGGLGRIGAAASGRYLALASRTDTGRLHVALQDYADHKGPTIWQGSDSAAAQCPAVAFDATGPLAVFIGQDGRPHTERLQTPGLIERLALRERLGAVKRKARAKALDVIHAPQSAELGTWRPYLHEHRAEAVERRPASHVQIIAHPDDDLYFMNPDVLHAVQSGDPVVTIVLAAGEADGVNSSKVEPGSTPDYEAYTAARHVGLRRAYAAMATGDPAAAWIVEERSLGSGLTLEEARLKQAPRIRLLFFNLRIVRIEGFDSMARMRSLWNGSIPYMRTLVPTGSPLSGPTEPSRAQLIDSLVELLAEAAPTVVRTLDPDPECNEFAPAGETSFHDHNDHTQSAYFAIEAVRRYRAGGAPGLVAVEAYRGYLNRELPVGLTEEDFASKKSYIDVYGGAGSRNGALGDRKVGERTNATGYGRSTAIRYPAATPWAVQSGGAGHAFAAVGGELKRWTGTTAWQEATALPHGRVDTDICAAVTPDQRIHLVAARLELSERYDSQVRRLDLCSQEAPDGDFGSWTSLGNPHTGGHAIQRHGLGAPVLLSDSDGALHVFVRNFSGGLHHASGRPGADWEGWWNLGGAGLQGPVAAADAGSGRLHALATTASGFAHWAGNGPRDGFDRLPDLDGLPTAPYGAPTLVPTQDGGFCLVTRLSQSGAVHVYRYTEKNGWTPGPVAQLPAPGGHGALAAAWSARDDRMLLASRDSVGGVRTAVCAVTTAETGSSAVWHHSGGLSLRSPALLRTDDGTVSILTLGPDARLHTATLRPDGTAAPWQQATQLSVTH